MDYSRYTDRQKSIVSGETPLSKVETFELRRLAEKALYRVDKDAIDMVSAELKRRNDRITIHENYTDKQQKIVSGETPLSEANQIALKMTLRTARFLGDEKTVARIEEEISSRGTLGYLIEGYSARASGLILGREDIEKVPDATVRALSKKAHELADIDVAEWADNELERRGLKGASDMLFSEDVEDRIGKIDGQRLTMLMTEARLEGDEDLLEVIEAEIEKRATRSRTIKYTSKETDVIKGEIPAERCSTWELRTLLAKLRLDDPDKQSVATLIEVEYERQLEISRERRAPKKDYTDFQKAVLNGNRTICLIKTHELKTILKKAVKRGDLKIAAFIDAEIRARAEKTDPYSRFTDLEQMVIKAARKFADGEKAVRSASVTSRLSERKKQDLSEEEKTLCNIVAAFRDDEYYQSTRHIRSSYAYTTRQTDILSGRISLSSVRTSELSRLIDKAKNFGDFDQAKRLEEERAERESSRHRSVRDMLDLLETEGIIRGEIPYESISLQSLLKIHTKASENHDYELMTLMENLIMDKLNDEEEKNKEHGKKKYPFHKTTYKPLRKNKEWGMNVLKSEEDADDCTDIDLQNIRLLAKTLDDPVYLKVAEFLIAERNDPTIVYIPETGKEAMDLILSLTVQPFRLPSEW